MYEYQCKIVRVVDGDTVDVDIDLGFGTWMKKQRIRLYGIDTPESRTRDLEEKKYGIMAKEIVKKYIPEGSTQILRTKKDKAGKYGRILGEFVVAELATGRTAPHGVTLNKWMIENHYGVTYTGQSKDDIAEQHLRNRELVFNVNPDIVT
ncbi:MAG: thermonuclease family protein [Candidatus Pacebacteria bacterium]|jgi:micrococcal nuclease|nr:thermonuclease family protein [Candidatus Paceibacterota bacterium]|tara:strand:+ start:41 stop:490 length:450 start_codon:yes stop_codon:yes gene_type:complete